MLLFQSQFWSLENKIYYLFLAMKDIKVYIQEIKIDYKTRALITSASTLVISILDTFSSFY